MSNDSLNSTMILPNPGGRRSQSSESPPPQLATSSSNALNSRLTDFQSENPLLLFAVDLLLLAGNVRALEPIGSVERLRTDVETMFSQLVSKLTQAGQPKDVVITTRYILCCLLDELVLSTPWGVDSVWSQQTLLGKFHNETWGGEKFYLIVNKVMERPAKDIHLLELCYVCLSLGFKGKYRVDTKGESEIQRLSNAMVQQILQVKPLSRDLSPAWQNKRHEMAGSRFYLPRWLQFSLLSILVMAVYVLFLTNLHTRMDPIYQRLDAINYDAFAPKKVGTAPRDIPTILKTLQTELADEISRRLITITAVDDDVYIRFINPAMFAPGSVQLQNAQMPNVDKLVNAMSQFAEKVTLLGHTDSSGAQQSNWVISKKRAEAVAAWLKTAKQPLYDIHTRGLADTRPLVDNDTATNRSLNRRVEIVLLLKD